MRNDSEVRIPAMVKKNEDNSLIFDASDLNLFRCYINYTSFAATNLVYEMNSANRKRGDKISFETQALWINGILTNGVSLSNLFNREKLYVSLFTILQTHEGWLAIYEVMKRKGYEWNGETRTFIK